MSPTTPRKTGALSNRQFDVLVVGGGITGAWTALDCALRGYTVALIEKNDFGGATSSRSSRLLHGGIRYLQKLELTKVRESALERKYVTRAAPHLFNHVPFLIPTYRSLRKSRAFLHAGMLGYRALSAGSHTGLEDPATRLPRDYSMNVSRLRSKIPLNDDRITGAWVLHECQMESSERMTQAVIARARQAGALLFNYLKLEQFNLDDGRVIGATVRDGEDGSRISVTANITVNAAGPWCDSLNRQLGVQSLNTGFARGAHIVTRQLIRDYALVLPSGLQGEGPLGRGERHIFIMPWRGHSLIGTSYQETSAPGDTLQVTGREIKQLMDIVNQTMPHVALDTDDVLHAFAGVYPLQSKTIRTDTYQGSGEYQLVDHVSKEGVEGIVTALGAKYTTARRLAELTTDLVGRKLNIARAGNVKRNPTRAIKLDGGEITDLKRFELERTEEYRQLWSPETSRHLIKRYGTRIDDLASICRDDPAFAVPVSSSGMTIGAELQFAVDREMAIHLSDATMRRTDLCTLGDPGAASLNHCAQILGHTLGWSESQQQAEVDSVRAELTTNTCSAGAATCPGEEESSI